MARADFVCCLRVSFPPALVLQAAFLPPLFLLKNKKGKKSAGKQNFYYYSR